jgi:hypothetical protein
VQRDLGWIVAERANNRVRHLRRPAGADRVKDFLARPRVQVDGPFADAGTTSQLIDCHPPITPGQQ